MGGKSTAKGVSRLDFLSPVTRIPGLGERRAEGLAAAEIETVGDLLYHLPYKYLDRSQVISINQLDTRIDTVCCVVGEIIRARVERGRKSRFRIQVADETGSLEALWFNGVQYLSTSLVKGKKVLLYGKVTRGTGLQMIHPNPEVISASKGNPVPFAPVYRVSEAMHECGVSNGILVKSIRWALDNLGHYPQILPDELEKKRSFPPLDKVLSTIHFPQETSRIETARERLKYEELYRLALTLRFTEHDFHLPGRSLSCGDLLEKAQSVIPFPLSPCQLTAVRELLGDAESPRRMHRLLQGDVGCGKTVTAFCASLAALNNKLGVLWVAPTAIVAQQTYTVLSSWLHALGFSSALLTASTERSEKIRILGECEKGAVDFVVGTHAVLQERVSFRSLGIVIVDEQHKFGVKQRLVSARKDPKSDFLLVTATPIPQTLAKTLYSDLQVTSISESRFSRSSVKSHCVPDEKRAEMNGFIKTHLENNDSRVFWIVPRISPDAENGPGLADIETTLRKLSRSPLAPFGITAMHGRTPENEAFEAVKDFKAGKKRIMVATTVVEVGVDVGEASVIVIENSERYGLSQLHQLRGRVGRKGQESFAFLLVSENAGDAARDRLKRFASIHDGFALADLDLSLRGPGEVSGWRQSGFDELQIADIMEDAELFKEISLFLKNRNIGVESLP